MSHEERNNLRMEIAERIVEDLFVNGQGQQAERLVLTSCDQKNLGGWSKRAVTDRIVKALHEKGEERCQVMLLEHSGMLSVWKQMLIHVGEGVSLASSLANCCERSCERIWE